MQKLVLGLLRLFFGLAGRIAPNRTAILAFRLFCTPIRRPPLRPVAEKLLDRAEAFDVPLGESTLRAFRWRPADAREDSPRVLLVHGWESRAAQLRGWVEPLLARGFEVLAFDGPAHGESGGRRASMPDFVTAIAEMDSVAGPFHAVLGHSLGAGASMIAVAGAHLTDLPPVTVERLVLVAGPDRALDFFRQFADLVGLNDRVFAGFLAQIEAIGGHPAEVYSTSALAADSDVSLLVVHDRDDAIVPATAAEAVAKASANATLRITEGLGHNRILRERSVIEQTVEFIAQGRKARAPHRAA